MAKRKINTDRPDRYVIINGMMKHKPYYSFKVYAENGKEIDESKRYPYKASRWKALKRFKEKNPGIKERK